MYYDNRPQREALKNTVKTYSWLKRKAEKAYKRGYPATARNHDHTADQFRRDAIKMLERLG